MKRWTTAAAFAFYLACLAFIAMPQGLDTEYRPGGVPALTPLSSNSEMQKMLGDYDAAAYARGAAEFARTGWIRSPGYLTLWPPGMFAVEALGLRLLGADGPAMLFLVCVNVLAWATVLLQIFLLASRNLPVSISLLLPLLLPAFPFFHQYLLRHGIMFSEGLSIALWSSGILLVIRGGLNERLRFGIAGGFLIALAAYVRGQIFGVMMIGSGVLAALLAIYLAICALRFGISAKGLKRTLHYLRERRFAVPVACMIAFHVFTIPYLVHNKSKYGRFEWAFFDYYYRYMWLLPEEYTPVQQFILRGGGPVACHVAPEKCAELRTLRNTKGEQAIPHLEYRKLAMRTFLTHPFSWMAFRASHLGPYWFSSPSTSPPSSIALVSGMLLAIAAALSLVFIVLLWGSSVFVPFLYVTSTIHAGTLAIFALTHYEVRYLYHLQATSIVLMIVGFCLVLQHRRAGTPDQGARAARG